jgi:hypothetical protein
MHPTGIRKPVPLEQHAMVATVTIGLDSTGKVYWKVDGQLARPDFNKMFETTRQDLLNKFFAHEASDRQKAQDAVPIVTDPAAVAALTRQG